MAMGLGFFTPFVVRWYWWRINGYGFSAGAILGMLSGFLVPVLFPDAPIYLPFIFVTSTALIGIIIGSYLSQPTDPEVLREFYGRIRPFGLWGPVRKTFSKTLISQINEENKRDFISLLLALPWMLVMFLIGITLVLREWTSLALVTIIFLILSVALYFTWYRHLGKEINTNDMN